MIPICLEQASRTVLLLFKSRYALIANRLDRISKYVEFKKGLQLDKPRYKRVCPAFQGTVYPARGNGPLRYNQNKAFFIQQTVDS
jgi:hypothetical protein